MSKKNCKSFVSGEKLKFKCPRAFELLGDGCFYHGDFTNEAQCLELCQSYYRGSPHEFSTEAICENGKDCKCRTPQLPNDIGERSLIVRLTDLEAQRATSLSSSAISEERLEDPVEVKCGYHDGLVTADECRRLCTDLQRDRGVLVHPASTCRKHHRCQCEEPDGDQHFFENLDTLEAWQRRRLEEENASNVRLWIETHNGVHGLFSDVDDTMTRFQGNP
ncbi:hypothetical protein QAD02_017033 [Eretmocerus hayati]|uniref:Uncharacterized protein n=1 Tax=Eretmocerus hayati TaxID=131215 RepID=A0ACC2PCQ1_9HYME|nr:hypothetical protein QAD02_017033 [Eretmocerus hayati]